MTETVPSTAAPAMVATTYTVQNFIDARQLKKDLAFSDNDLDTAMMEQASLFVHYAELAADAAHQVDVVEMLLTTAEASVYKLLRDKKVEDREKVVVSDLNLEVARHSRVISMKKALNEAKRVEALGKAALEAFKQRRDMLIQIGTSSRQERAGELAITNRNAREDALAAERRRVAGQLSTRGGEQN